MKSISKVTSLANWDGSNGIILRLKEKEVEYVVNNLH